MAQIFSLEPQTTAKVLMKTTFGDLELELWGAQTPQTTRNFLQLCLDGYYNDTIFHRLVPGFIIQGGDPTGTGHGGEAIYPGGLFADEFHSRLKYNRRGLLGMANGGRPDDNGSQFFLTLGDTKELNGKNTLFGKIVGDTVFNLVRMGELEVDGETERPLYPPRVVATEVLVNPFEDVKKREVKKSTETLEGAAKKEPAKRKKKPGKALLSFGGDEEDADSATTAPVKKKPKFNTRLVVDAPAPPPSSAAAAPPPKRASPPPPPRQATPPRPRSPSPPRPERKPRPAVPSRSPSPAAASRGKLAETEAQIAAVKASLRRSRSPPAEKAAPSRKGRSLLETEVQHLI